MMEGMDAKFYLSITFYIINSIVLFYVWLGNRRAATTKSIDDLKIKQEREQKDIEKRVLVLETDRDSALKHEDLEGIFVELRGIGKGLSKLEGRFESVDSLNAAIQQIGLRSKS